MSVFLTGAGGLTGSLLQASDSRIMAWQDRLTWIRFQPWQDAALWPRSRFVGTDSWGSAQLTEDAQFTGRWDVIPEEGGGQQQRKIIGLTYNSSGVALGSVVVQGYVTATDGYVGAVTSDAGGYYELPTPYVATAHYLVAYQAGSPDVTGATVNTLVPS